MHIALDYDNTYTADRNTFKAIIRCFQSSGHKVTCVTLRNGVEDWHEDFKELKEKYDVDTVFCDGQSKREITEKHDIKINIWIDDWPEGISIGSQYNPLQLLSWRQDQIENGGITPKSENPE